MAESVETVHPPEQADDEKGVKIGTPYVIVDCEDCGIASGVVGGFLYDLNWLTRAIVSQSGESIPVVPCTTINADRPKLPIDGGHTIIFGDPPPLS